MYEDYRIHDAKTDCGLKNELEWNDGRKYPDIESFEDERIDFYKDCLKHPISNDVKSIYLTYLVEKAPDRYSYVNDLIEVSYKLFEAYKPVTHRKSSLSNDDLNSEDKTPTSSQEDVAQNNAGIGQKFSENKAIKQISKICIFAVRFSLSDQCEKVLKRLINVLTDMKNTASKHIEWLYAVQYIRLCRYILLNKKKLNITDADSKRRDVIEIIKQLITTSWDAHEYSSTELLQNELFYWYKALQMSAEYSALIVDQIQMLTEEGDELLQKKEYFQAVGSFENALKLGFDNNISTNRDELKAKITDCYGKGGEEIKPSSFQISIDNAQINYVIHQFITGDPYNDFRNFAGFLSGKVLYKPEGLYPILSQERESANNRVQDSIWQFIGYTKLKGNRKIREAKTTEDNAEINAIDMFCTQLQLLSVSFILPALDKLVDEGLTPDMMFHQMSAIGLTRPQQLMLGTALYRYFSDDYVSYLHIAMPLTESIFRDLFANRGYSTTVLSNGTAMNEQVFNTFLDNEYVKRLTPPVLLDMISITMVNQLGLNLRNDIAHGICEEKDYSKTNCGISLLILVLITMFNWIKYAELNNAKVDEKHQSEDAGVSQE